MIANIVSNSEPRSTIDVSSLSETTWDVVIVGAGVAGTAAAIHARKLGLKTLLIEAKSFPREKVCGGCINQAAQSSLTRLGILDQVVSAGCVPLDALHLQIMQTSACWSVPTMLSVRRSVLDALLVNIALEAGVQYIDQAVGTLVPSTSHSNAELRSVRVQAQDTTVTIEAKCVLIASGLTRSSLKDPATWPSQVDAKARIGVQCILPKARAKDYTDGKLHMLVGRNGYVGICSTDDDLVDVAAAIDPASIQPMGGIERVVRGILEDCDANPLDWPPTSEWLATPALTRSSLRVADRRVFLLGDAIGYVEPFTGQGMEWAFASAEAVMQLVQKTVHGAWHDEIADQWDDWAHRQRIYKQRTCRWLANRIRRPRGAAWVLRACDWIPPLRASIIRKTT